MTKTTILYPRWPLYATALAFSLLLVAPAHAAGSGMPWEAPLQSILESIEGPVAKILATIVIILTGLGLAFGESISGKMKQGMRPIRGGAPGGRGS